MGTHDQHGMQTRHCWSPQGLPSHIYWWPTSWWRLHQAWKWIIDNGSKYFNHEWKGVYTAMPAWSVMMQISSRFCTMKNTSPFQPTQDPIQPLWIPTMWSYASPSRGWGQSTSNWIWYILWGCPILAFKNWQQSWSWMAGNNEELNPQFHTQDAKRNDQSSTMLEHTDL